MKFFKKSLFLLVSLIGFFGFCSADNVGNSGNSSSFGIIQSLIDLGELCLGFFNFIIFGVKSLFVFVGRLFLKVFSLDFWELFFDFTDEISLYLGDYVIFLLTGLMLLFLVRFFRFIVRLFKGEYINKKGF